LANFEQQPLGVGRKKKCKEPTAFDSDKPNRQLQAAPDFLGHFFPTLVFLFFLLFSSSLLLPIGRLLSPNRHSGRHLGSVLQTLQYCLQLASTSCQRVAKSARIFQSISRAQSQLPPMPFLSPFARINCVQRHTDSLSIACLSWPCSLLELERRIALLLKREREREEK